ncbi:hypothetical protein ACH4JS_32130 [Streptomyces sp. NPDC017638]|uniref:hypothetical protein n=1 Tax=Streptomyces sp. NPDC017638 TaxID=3365004 RepID=UPI003792588B
MPAAAHQTVTAPAPRAARARQAAAWLLGLACAALATVVWSGSFVTARGLHDSVPPLEHAFTAAVRKGAAASRAVTHTLNTLTAAAERIGRS